MEIGSQAVQKLYGDALKAAQPSPLEGQDSDLSGGGSGTFNDMIADAAQDTIETLAHGEQTARAAMAGKADPHSVVEALAATEMALEMAVTVRDKVVQAYQEILRMPV
ncbi:MAG: flagellar hook-basal body complex protein FliE [Rhodobacteraceae bacterium]|nr:flagellar hook-basal body complex protein FliE [Paracoccaceae bacterium]